MADPKTPQPDVDTDEIETQQALEQGLGVGARELAAIHESGAQGTLERAADREEGEDEEETIEADSLGRSHSVLDRDEEA